MSRTLRAVVFDVDGTLIDSVMQHAQAWREAFMEFGHDIPVDAIRGQIGKGGDQLMPVFLSEADIGEMGEALQDRRAEILKQRYLGTIKPFPQARALLTHLTASGLRVALASSAKQDELEVYKRIANIADLVHEQTTSDDAGRSKPYPDIFTAVIDRLSGISSAEMLAVGDTPYDAEAAVKAGLKIVGVRSGAFGEAELRQAGCCVVYRDLAEMLANWSTARFGFAA